MNPCFEAQLNRHYAELELLDSLADQEQSTNTWFVATSAWEEYAETKDQLNELLAFAVLDGLEAKVETIPF